MAVRITIAVLAFVALTAALLIFLYYIFRVLLPRRAEEIEKSFPGDVVKFTRQANFFGQKSSGLKRIKGNGIFALTPREVVFYMFYPRREWHVPLDRLERIEHPKWFMKRSALREIIVLEYTNEHGEEDAMGVLVRDDPREWAGEIRSAALRSFDRIVG